VAEEGPCAGIGAPMSEQRVANSDGSVTHVYGSGIDQVVVTDPPEGFDPLTATDRELEAYNFPARPPATADEEEQRDWVEDVTAERGPAQPPCVTTSYAAHIDAYKWSGFLVDAGAKKFEGVKAKVKLAALGNWNVPGCQAASLVSWVGLGGQNSASLIQAGIGYLYGSPGTPVAWYEWVDATHTIPITTFPNSISLHKNDQVKITVTRSSTGWTTFSVNNLTRGVSSVYARSLPASYWDGSTAEWIDERTTSGTTITQLLPFKPIDWSAAKMQTTDGTWHTLQSGAQHQVWMQGGSTAPVLLAKPDNGLTSSTAFTDYFHKCS